MEENKVAGSLHDLNSKQDWLPFKDSYIRRRENLMSVSGEEIKGASEGAGMEMWRVRWWSQSPSAVGRVMRASCSWVQFPWVTVSFTTVCDHGRKAYWGITTCHMLCTCCTVWRRKYILNYSVEERKKRWKEAFCLQGAHSLAAINFTPSSSQYIAKGWLCWQEDQWMEKTVLQPIR